MTRTQLANKVAMDSNSTFKASRQWTEAVLNSLADAIEHEQEVKIQGLGNFEHIVRKPRVGRNYKTGERVEIPAKTIIQFSPCRRIQESVRHEADGDE
jgi:nucleoid DNA-binding protein